jgi:hypothetical protein
MIKTRKLSKKVKMMKMEKRKLKSKKKVNLAVLATKSVMTLMNSPLSLIGNDFCFHVNLEDMIG